MVRPGCAKCAQAARARRALGRVVVVPPPCRSLAAGRVTGLGGRIVALCRAPAHIVGLPLALSQPWLCCIATQPAATPLIPNCPLVTIQILYRDTIPPACQASSCHDTFYYIVTLTPNQVLSLSRDNLLYRDTLPQPKLSLPVTIQSDCIVT